VALRDKSPEALVDGQQQALAEILTELEGRLVKDAAKAPPPYKSIRQAPLVKDVQATRPAN
jgi:hypothetical protein